MSELITPEQLPDWVPGELTNASDGLGWRNVSLRAYRYLGQDVYVPPMRDFMLVSYQRGNTPMERRFDGSWTHTTCVPGSVSLLTRAQCSHWNWSRNVDVAHVYLSEELLAALACEAMDGAVAQVRLRDVLNVEDPLITQAIEAIRAESVQQGFGGSLYVESIGAQLALHLLRHYATISPPPPRDASGLSPMQQERVIELVESRLDQRLDLQALAAAAGLGICSFSRRFRKTFGRSPYAYVLERRLARARGLVEGGTMALKAIAPACGFNDQAHMTRVFKSRLAVTPGALRRQARR